MKDQGTKTVGFLKTTAIGGLIFLLPLAVIGGWLGWECNRRPNRLTTAEWAILNDCTFYGHP